MALAAVTLDDKYTLERGRVYLTGTQALVRLPMMQRQRDVAAGLNTACFISGYRGSPLGGLDQGLWSARRFLERNHIRFQPAINEELGATAVWGSQQIGLFPGAKYDGVFAMWYGKGPGVDRSGDALKHGNAAGSAPHGGVLLLAGDDHTCKSSTLPHQSEYAFMDACDPGAEPVGRAGDPRPRPLWLGDVALFRAAGSRFKTIAETVDSSASVEIDPGAHRDRAPRRFRDAAGRAEYPLARSSRSSRNTGCINTSSTRLWLSPAPTGSTASSSTARGRGSASSRPANPTSTCARRSTISGSTTRMPPRSASASTRSAMSWPLEREGIRAFRRGARGNPRRRGKTRRHREPVQGAALQLARRTCARASSASSTRTGNWILPSNGELTPAQIARVIAAAHCPLSHLAADCRTHSPFSRRRNGQLGGNVVPFSRTPVFLLGLPAQHLHQGAGGQPRGGRHRLPLSGSVHGSVDCDFYPDGRRGRALDRSGAVHRDAACLRQSRRRHLRPFRRAGDPRGGRRQGQHHLQAAVQRRRGDDRRAADRRRLDRAGADPPACRGGGAAGSSS